MINKILKQNYSHYKLLKIFRSLGDEINFETGVILSSNKFIFR